MQEIALWRAVITQAIQDSLSKSPVYQNKIDAKAARQWLLSSDAHLRRVCEMADINHDQLHRSVKRIFDDPTEFQHIIKHPIPRHRNVVKLPY